MKKCMRLVVPSSVSYILGVLSELSKVQFPDKQVVDVPLETSEQVTAANKLAAWMEQHDGRTYLRNSPNAVDVYSVEVIDLP